MFSASNEDMARVAKALQTNLFAPVEIVETGEDAVEAALKLIPPEARVGIPGTTSVRQIGLISRLRARGNTVFDSADPSDLPAAEQRRQILFQSEVYLASCNAITLDGKIVNIDGGGNRVSGTIFGPRQVIFIAGANKIVPTVDEAIWRIKNIIAPYHNMVRGRKVPCAKTLRCSDCKSPNRSCRVTVIMEKKPRNVSIAVILVKEDLGLGWDPEWPQERKDKIALVYRQLIKELAGPK